jgi:iron-sulfur cluster assembly protein
MEDFTVTLSPDETLLSELLKGGAELAHECGGKLACATCCVVISEGRDALNQPSDDELDMLDRAGVAETGARLACQVHGAGEVVIRIPRLTAPPLQSTMTLAVTAEAASFLALQLAKHASSVGMRLAVTPAGCSGLRYRLDPIDLVRKDDALFECAGLRLAVDPVSLPFIQGTRVRLAREGLATRLRFDNPNARKSCGCGESFGT